MTRLPRSRGLIAGLLLGALFTVLVGGTRESLRAQAGIATVRVQGVVFDSIGNRPLGGALVQLIELPPGRSAHTATSDSLGRFRMDSVTPGSYMAGFLDPLLDSIGIEAANEGVQVREGAPTRIALAVPSAQHVARAICGNGKAAAKSSNASSGDNAGMIVGHAREADTGALLPGTAVTLQWQTLDLGSGTAHTESHSLRATTVGEGWFAMCGIAADEYHLHAEHGRQQTGLLDIVVHPHEILRLSLLLASDSVLAPGDSAPRGRRDAFRNRPDTRQASARGCAGRGGWIDGEHDHGRAGCLQAFRAARRNAHGRSARTWLCARARASRALTLRGEHGVDRDVQTGGDAQCGHRVRQAEQARSRSHGLSRPEKSRLRPLHHATGDRSGERVQVPAICCDACRA